MDFSSRKIQAIAAGIALLVIIAGIVIYHARGSRPEATRQGMAGGEVASSSALRPDSPPAGRAAPDGCLGKAIAVKLGAADFRIPGSPALTLVVGAGVDDDIDFSTREGIGKGCSQPVVTAKAIALNFDAMDKNWGVPADWRAGFCGDLSNEAMRFLCLGEDRQAGTPRRLAVATVYDPKDFDGETMFHRPAPQLANFTAWKQEMAKAGTSPPVQPDGAFDVYPGGIWFERDAGKPLLFSCDTDSFPVTGQHYCIGSLDLDGGLRARVEFRTVTGKVGAEAAAAAEHLRTLLAAWR
ncbi:hypothetical protein [Labrys monachus]|nr:hypothetical protein [Labrys monachus]